jgi:polyhydroxyalkanoate synthase
MTAATLWTASRAGLPLWKNGWLSWRPELAEAASALAPTLAAADTEKLAEAVDHEVRSQAAAFAEGLERYRHHPYRRSLADPPVVWSEGTTRLVDYAPEGGAPVLVVPSLVNRGYVLDLSAERSFLRYLAAHGMRPFLLDWDRPGEAERRFTLTDYIAGRLEGALDAILDRGGGPVSLIGYCMGGLLALGLAQRRRRDLCGLALLATPWDFHAEQAGHAKLLGSIAEPVAATFSAIGQIPTDVLQSLFFALDPLLALRKFSRFSRLRTESSAAQEFVALEDWLNDGVPLALPVAREAMTSWYGENEPGRGLWRVAGRPVLPERIELPALVVVPGADRIVPPGSARGLAERLPRARTLAPPLGHIGMIVGSHAERAVWRPVADWLRDAAAPGGWTRVRGSLT